MPAPGPAPSARLVVPVRCQAGPAPRQGRETRAGTRGDAVAAHFAEGFPANITPRATSSGEAASVPLVRDKPGFFPNRPSKRPRRFPTTLVRMIVRRPREDQVFGILLYSSYSLFLFASFYFCGLPRVSTLRTVAGAVSVPFLFAFFSWPVESSVGSRDHLILVFVNKPLSSPCRGPPFPLSGHSWWAPGPGKGAPARQALSPWGGGGARWWEDCQARLVEIEFPSQDQGSSFFSKRRPYAAHPTATRRERSDLQCNVSPPRRRWYARSSPVEHLVQVFQKPPEMPQYTTPKPGRPT